MDRNKLGIGGIGVLLGLCFMGLVLTYGFATTRIATAEVGVVTTFGRVDTSPSGTLTPGIHVVAPWHGVEHISTAPVPYEVESKDVGTVGDKDGVQVGFDMTLPYAYSENCAAAIVYHGGVEKIEPLVRRYASAAMRTAAADFTWTQMVITDRDALATDIEKIFSSGIKRDLIKQGYTEKEANTCIIVFDVKLQSISPPGKILDAVSEKAATQIILENQENLNKIAAQQADRRKTEGDGIAQLMNALPKDFNAEQVSKILGAVATKENADSLERAVREGKIQMMVVPYGQEPSVSMSLKE